MDVILLDPGLSNRGEHSYNIAKDVVGALKRRDIGHRLFGTKSLDPSIAAELSAAPLFTYTLYDHCGALVFETLAQTAAGLCHGKLPHQARTPSERRTKTILSKMFRRDLETLPPDIGKADQLFLLPAISQNQILGLVDYLLAKRENERPLVLCELMFAPTWTPWSGQAKCGAAYYEEAFARAAPLLGRRLFFAVENAAMAALYKDRFGIASEILPIPLTAPPARLVERSPVRLGFFGYSKMDKGFHLLPEAARLCLQKGLDVAFAVQVQHTGWERETVAAEALLRKLPNVHLIEGTLSSEAYCEEIGEIDIMLLPYHPERFGMRGSGVFTESVAAGRPIIAAEGIFAAKAIADGEAEGEIFAPYEATALAAAIERLLPRLSACRLRAAERATLFARSHSADAYVDIVLAHARDLGT